ncbi:hypothetical protein ACXJJ3_30935 [Kribbella sp. WER1]
MGGLRFVAFGIAALAATGLVAGAGAGIAALVGLARGGAVGDAAFVGAGIGLGVVMAWLVVSLVVVAVLWVRGVSPSETASGRPAAGRHAAGGYGWRRRGEPLVPGSLVAFFVLMAIMFGSLGLQARSVARPPDGPTARTSGTVVAVHEPPWYEKGSGTVDIRYSVDGAEFMVKTGRDPGEHLLALGEVVPIEYELAEPSSARCVWTVESARDDQTFWLWLGGSCAALALLSGLGYGVPRWRSSGRRGG